MAAPKPPAPVDDGIQAAELPTAYRESRTSVLLGAGESELVTLTCDFEPERVLVDPDCLVLQLRREAAVKEF